jgi:toxin ParE1/3/4
MAGRVIWRRVAEQDLLEIYLYLGAKSASAAEGFVDAVGDAVEFLRETPSAGRLRDFRSPLARGIRSWAPPDFANYLIFYRVEGGDIEIVRLLHGARDIPRILEEGQG